MKHITLFTVSFVFLGEASSGYTQTHNPSVLASLTRDCRVPHHAQLCWFFENVLNFYNMLFVILTLILSSNVNIGALYIKGLSGPLIILRTKL